MTRDDLGDRELLEETVAGFCEALATPIARGWQLSQQATLLALARTLGFLALRYVEEHPQARSSILTTLYTLADCVETETATKQ